MPRQKVSIGRVADMIKNGAVIIAIKWDYEYGGWKGLSQVALKDDNGKIGIYCSNRETGIILNCLINMSGLSSTELHPIVPLINKRNK